MVGADLTIRLSLLLWLSFIYAAMLCLLRAAERLIRLLNYKQMIITLLLEFRDIILLLFVPLLYQGRKPIESHVLLFRFRFLYSRNM